ncbi:hypothetical protein [Actibacterium sp. 188UL27-1]|uniref:hypothetical protein n=1 Tax=Actibacterium sp. 188UL27-1 TaxID=2786961 RepID=UPI0019567C6F|nr:hypothetical protein [Actibacterium sp. 188UL27-1]MBM7067881.1 hypothetical protein [Actibacterium sp. 188UL27-1]
MALQAFFGGAGGGTVPVLPFQPGWIASFAAKRVDGPPPENDPAFKNIDVAPAVSPHIRRLAVRRWIVNAL